MPLKGKEELRREEVVLLRSTPNGGKDKYKSIMAKKLYVGGLPYSTTQDELKNAFSQAGAVESASIITDKMTGRSRGFGFVEMTNDEEAEKAIEMWNGKDFGGRTLTVNEAKPMGDRPARREGGFRGGRGNW